MDVDAAKPQGDGDQQQEQQKDGQQQKEEEGAKDGSAAAAKEEAPQAAGGATAAAATAAAQPKANKDSHEFTPVGDTSVWLMARFVAGSCRDCARH